MVNYRSCLFKILQLDNPRGRISNTAIAILDEIIRDVLESIAEEAARLCKCEKRKTLLVRDIRSATQLIFSSNQIRQQALNFADNVLLTFSSAE